MFKTTIWLAGFLAAVPAGAADLAGTVNDPAQQPISSARVVVSSRAGAARFLTFTSDQGRFHVSRLASGDYWVQVSAPGFGEFSGQVTLAAGDVDLPVTLQVNNVRTEVIVTASAVAQSADETARAVDVVDSAQLRLRDRSSLGEALQGVPGLRVQQVGGPGSLVRILSRGLRPQDTAVTIDGLRFRDAATTQGDATPFLETMFPAGSERIEVMRGTGSSLYGSHALGGVVNIVTDTGGGRRRGSLLVEGGGLGFTRSSASLSGGLAADRITYSAALQHVNVINGNDGRDPFRNSTMQGAANYFPNSTTRLGGRLWWSDTFALLNSTPYSAPASLLSAAGAIRAIPVSLETQRLIEAGQPFSWGGANFVPNLNDPDSRRASRFLAAAAFLEKEFTPAVQVRATYQRVSTRRVFEDGLAGVRFQPAFRTVTLIDGGVDTANVRASLNSSRWSTTTFGYEWERETYDSPYRDYNPVAASRQDYRARAHQHSHSLFGHQQFRWLQDRLQLSVSGRAQGFRLSAPEFAGAVPLYAGLTFSSPRAARTGDLAVSYSLLRSGTKLRAHAGNGYRAPSIYERFGASFFEGSFSALGDPRLRPDRSRAFEFGIDQYAGGRKLRLSASYFYTDLREVIAFDSSGFITPVTDPFGRSGGYRNTSGGIARGVEASAELALFRGSRIQSSYTYTDSTVRVSSVRDNDFFRATFQSPHQASVIWVQHFARRWDVTADFWAAAAHAQIYSRRAFLFDGARRADLALHYTHPLSESTSLRVYTKWNNVFDSQYLENGFRTPGVWGLGGLSLQF
ncbi:MAG: TonB-dependent receptor domain-containing protein [Bryobacteraceae bacterium]